MQHLTVREVKVRVLNIPSVKREVTELETYFCLCGPLKLADPRLNCATAENYASAATPKALFC